MGTDPATSVTDPVGRFHQVASAYCCDQAVFPTVGSVNPVLTGLVLAHRLAHELPWLGPATEGPAAVPQAQKAVTASGSPMNWSTARTFPSSTWK
jgi:choline dehydrogenase-like flavoprotein